MNQVATVARVATAEEKTEDSASEWISIGFKLLFRDSSSAASALQKSLSACKLGARIQHSAFSISGHT